jgi:hypothetical protein
MRKPHFSPGMMCKHTRHSWLHRVHETTDDGRTLSGYAGWGANRLCMKTRMMGASPGVSGLRPAHTSLFDLR